MAFADPQSLTIATVATSFPKTVTEPHRSVFRGPDGTRLLTTSQSGAGLNGVKGTLSSLMRLDTTKINTDVFDIKTAIGLDLHLVVKRPVVGFTETEFLAEWVTFNAWLTAGGNAVLKKAWAGES